MMRGIVWQNSLKNALESTAPEKRLIIVVLTSLSCGACSMMETNTFGEGLIISNNIGY